MYLTPHTTDRLTIRQLQVSDIDLWPEFFVNNENLKFFGWNADINPAQISEEWITRQIGRYNDNIYGLMALTNKNTNDLIGQCGLLTQEIEGKKEIEIGYHVLPKYWGKGYATEAALYFKKFAFDNDLSDTLISIIHIDNIRSQKVAEKNGMKRTIRSEFKERPVYIYRINKKDYLTQSL